MVEEVDLDAVRVGARDCDVGGRRGRAAGDDDRDLRGQARIRVPVDSERGRARVRAGRRARGHVRDGAVEANGGAARHRVRRHLRPQRERHALLVARRGGLQRHGQVLEPARDRGGDLVIGDALLIRAVRRVHERRRLAGRVEPTAVHGDGDDARPRSGGQRGRDVGERVPAARIVTGRVAEPGDDPRRVGAPADVRVGGEPVERVQLRLRRVTPGEWARDEPRVDRRLHGRRVARHGAAERVRDVVAAAEVLVVGGAELRERLRRAHRAHDAGDARLHVVNGAAHAPRRIGEKDHVGLRRDRRRSDPELRRVVERNGRHRGSGDFVA